MILPNIRKQIYQKHEDNAKCHKTPQLSEELNHFFYYCLHTFYLFALHIPQQFMKTAT